MSTYILSLKLEAIDAKLECILTHLRVQGEILSELGDMVANGSMTPGEIAQVVERLVGFQKRLQEIAK